MVALQKDYSTGTQHKSRPSAFTPRFELDDMYDILHRHYDPLEWIIPDYLPEGCTLFFADPKVGKSMTMLAIMMRMARHTHGGVDGEVLYLSLDDTNKRRLQGRARSLLQGEEIQPGQIQVVTSAETLDDDRLLQQLEDHMEWHPACKLVCIDVYARVKPSGDGDDIYKRDYTPVAKLQEFATNHHIAIVLIHHTNKRPKAGEHWQVKISGSRGLPAAVDTMWYVEREEATNNLTLKIQGRDIEREIWVKLSLDDIDAPWDVLEMSHDQSEEPAKAHDLIYECLRNTQEPMKPQRIAELTGINAITVRLTCRRMLNKRMVNQNAFGAYLPVGISIVSKNEGNTEKLQSYTILAPSEDVVTLTQPTPKTEAEPSPEPLVQVLQHDEDDTKSCNFVTSLDDANKCTEYKEVTATAWIPCISKSCATWVPNTAWSDVTFKRGKTEMTLHMATCPQCGRTFNRDAQTRIE